MVDLLKKQRLTERFVDRMFTRSDINEHLGFLAMMASICTHVTEFGVRGGNSTLALLQGLGYGGRLVSYDINPDCEHALDGVEFWNRTWVFHQADTSKLDHIEFTELLFIDTLHTYQQVRAELKHATSVQQWILLHDTVLFGEHGERGEEGIMRAVDEFLLANRDSWRLRFHFPHNCGLSVLERIK